jgi:hypothetical protein
VESTLARERFDLSFVRRMFAEQRAGRVDHNFRIWNLWNLAAWYACWFERALPGSTPLRGQPVSV